MGKMYLGIARGSRWYAGDAMSGDSSVGTVFPDSEIEQAYKSDMYFDKKGNVYQCVEGGSPTEAKWICVGSYKWPFPGVIDGFDSTSVSQALSANSGKILNDRLDKDLPFGFGIDIDGNYGYIPYGSDKVTPFGSGILSEVHDGILTQDQQNPIFVIINKGRLTISMQLQKNAPEPYTYTYSVIKNEEVIKEETVTGDVGVYQRLVEIEVNEGDIISFASSEPGNLNIFYTAYVGSVSASGGEPVYNIVLAELEDLTKEVAGIMRNHPLNIVDGKLCVTYKEE